MKDKRDIWTVSDVLNAMSGSNGSKDTDLIVRVVRDVQAWLISSSFDEMRVDLVDIASGNDRAFASDLDTLFDKLSWVSQYADLIPAMQEPARHEDAIILSVGPIVLDEGMRMLVDHAALFGADKCKRVWLVSDTWLIADIWSYMPHLRALADRGVEVRFILVTPWSASEIPWNKDLI